MAATADITIESFNLQEALEGTPVTLESINGVITDMNTQTGILQKDHAMYRVVINGVLYQLNKDGVVAKGTSAGTQANLVKAAMITTYGGRQGQTRSATTGYHDLGYVAALEPRDHFAMSALAIMMEKLEGLEKVNDSTILLYCRAAYRWAQGMMIVAADMREQVEDEPTEEVGVDPEALTENIEKLLYNIHAALKEGVAINGTDRLGAPAVKTAIDGEVQVSLSGTPEVQVTNTPLEIEGTVSVDNFPEEQ